MTWIARCCLAGRLRRTPLSPRAAVLRGERPPPLCRLSCYLVARCRPPPPLPPSPWRAEATPAQRHVRRCRPRPLPVPVAAKSPRAPPSGSRTGQAEREGEGGPISPCRPAISQFGTVRHNPSGSLQHPREKDVRGDSRAFPRDFLHGSVSCSDQNRRGPEANAHRNVAHFITDHEPGAGIRHLEPTEDLLGQPRPRFSASAREPIRLHRPFRV